MTLYEDKHIRLTQTELEIKWYYFPTTGKRTIELGKITAVYYEPHHMDVGTTKSWGQSLTPVWLVHIFDF
jgi:hypothetical protein